jgi:TolB protein
MKFTKSLVSLMLTALLGAFATANLRADDTIEIGKTTQFLGRTPPTPIAILGFSGEVASVLRFDLTVMGFKDVPAESAQYVLSGSNSGNVQGLLSVGKSPLFSKAYNGASLRAQAHRLADDVVLKITGVSGIAETKIAFKAESGGGGEIYVSDFDGHNPQAVTRDHTIVAAPCWVPGRLALYYTSYILGPPDIFYQDLATSQRQNFASYPGGDNSSAAVSSDGSRVAMVCAMSGSPNIYVCNSDRTGFKQLTHTTEADSSPCWSPDGQWICFASTVGGRRALYRVSAGGGPMERIPTSGVLNPTEPDWSPDGKWIAFTSQMRDFQICVIPAKGGIATALVSGEDPSWAPNSRTLVFVRRGRGSAVLSLLDVPTKQVKDASRVTGSNSQPSWAR